VGDGTTSVVILAAELLKRANELVKCQIHPTNIISGYRIAMREACKFIEDKMAIPTDSLGTEALINCAKTAMSSKIVGADDDFFAKLVVDSINSVKTVPDLIIDPEGKPRYPVKAINVLKAHGKSATESCLLNGKPPSSCQG
jgi:T-complex protein 1 subunit alpha